MFPRRRAKHVLQENILGAVVPTQVSMMENTIVSYAARGIGAMLVLRRVRNVPLESTLSTLPSTNPFITAKLIVLFVLQEKQAQPLPPFMNRTAQSAAQGIGAMLVPLHVQPAFLEHI